MHACKHTYVHVYIYNYIYVRYIWYTNHIDSFFPWSFKALCHRMHQCPMASMASLNKFHLFIPETPVKVPFFHIFQFKLYHHLSTVFLYPAKSMSTTWSKEQKEVGEVVRLHLRVIAIHRRFIWPCHDTCIVAKAIDLRVFCLPERQV